MLHVEDNIHLWHMVTLRVANPDVAKAMLALAGWHWQRIAVTPDGSACQAVCSPFIAACSRVQSFDPARLIASVEELYYGSQQHRNDRDCHLYLFEDLVCLACGADHGGEPCPLCGGRGYHEEDCDLLEPRALRAGDRAMVYEDHVARKRPEGYAAIVEILSHDQELDLTEARVDFNGDTYNPVRRRVSPLDRIVESGEREG